MEDGDTRLVEESSCLSETAGCSTAARVCRQHLLGNEHGLEDTHLAYRPINQARKS